MLLVVLTFLNLGCNYVIAVSCFRHVLCISEIMNPLCVIPTLPIGYDRSYPKSTWKRPSSTWDSDPDSWMQALPDELSDLFEEQASMEMKSGGDGKEEEFVSSADQVEAHAKAMATLVPLLPASEYGITQPTSTALRGRRSYIPLVHVSQSRITPQLIMTWRSHRFQCSNPSNPITYQRHNELRS